MKISEIVRVTGGKLISGDNDADIAPGRISTDSRTIKRGDLFIAIKGPNFDGNKFVGDALRKGVLGAIIKQRVQSTEYSPPRQAIAAGRGVQSKLYSKKIIITVKDTVAAYGDIARAHRSKFNIPIIAVTGSNGKTTTKDIIWHILSGRFRVLKNIGTNNNHIGVPETILKLTGKFDAAVLELGMNHIGEIMRLSRISGPSIGIVTNVGPSHLQFLGNLDNVFKAKRELLDSLPRRGLAILNGDDRLLMRFKTRRLKVVTFGFGAENDVRASDVFFTKSGSVFTVNGQHPFKLNLMGRHNIYNALAAIVVARHMGLGFSYMRKRLVTFREPSGMRLGRRKVGAVDFINDSYNSNPLSLKHAIDVLSIFDTPGRRFLVTGDMLELGKLSRVFHAEAGELAAGSNIDYLFALGRLSGQTRRAALRRGMGPDRARLFATHAEAARCLKRMAMPNDVVLVKGSRAMRMEKVIEEFEKLNNGDISCHDGDTSLLL